MSDNPPILYCRCAFARVIPEEVKDQVLSGLLASEQPFDSVPDLCEMSARKDPQLERLAKTSGLRIVACYPRAVRWLFSAAGSPLDSDKVDILNMRTETAQTICSKLGVAVPDSEDPEHPESDNEPSPPSTESGARS